jgi:3-hydroxyacyl-CoA dehydrogenase
MTFKKIAVIGAGAMGAGIAQVSAAAGLEVTLIDVTTELVEKGIRGIAKRCESAVQKGKMAPQDRDLLLGRLKGAAQVGEAAGVDLVIEAIIEDQRIKGDLFASLNRICSPETVFATNTSTLSVTALGALSGRPSRFLGLHFFNPVTVMKLVEVIPGLETGSDVVESATATMKEVRKTPIKVQDCPGFLVNRVLLTYVGEALLCAQEGIPPEEIDGEAKKAGFPMGPLELSDMVGWDVSLHTLPVLNDAYGERFPFPILVQKLNDAGRLGLKAGKGIYRDGIVDDEFHAMVKALGQVKKEQTFSADRLTLRQVNEAVYCIQEGVATPQEIDRAMVLGTGFPNVKGLGGPLAWADEKGLDVVLATLTDLAAKEGARFLPHHLLKTYVAAGRLGRKTKKGFFDYKA